MEIKYIEIRDRLETKCPFKKGWDTGSSGVANVASTYCEMICDNFESINRRRKIVNCHGDRAKKIYEAMKRKIKKDKEVKK